MLTPLNQRQVAWHSLKGIKRYDEGEKPSLVEAIQENHLDFEVHAHKVQANVGGTFVSIPEQRAIFKSALNGDKPRFFGITGPNWQPVQNLQIATLLQPLLDSGQFTLDAVGSANEGQDLIIALKAESFEIAGDQLTEYAIFRDSKRPGVAMQVKVFANRLFCTNQLPSIGRASNFTAGIVHGKGAEGQLRFQADILPLLAKARASARRSFQQMAAHTLEESEIDAALAFMYPDPKLPGRARTLATLAGAEVDLQALDPEKVGELDTIWRNYQSAQERTLSQRRAVKLLYDQFNDQHSQVAQTSWALFNVAVEDADHRQGRADEGTEWSALFGQRAAEKDRAYNAAMSLADPGFDQRIPEYTPTERAGARRGRPRRELTPEEQERANEAAARRAARQARRDASGMTVEQERAQKELDRAVKAKLRLERAQAEADRLAARVAALQEREAAARALLAGQPA